MGFIDEADLRRGLEAAEIVAFAQKLVDLRTGRTLGYEALARWRHPAGQLVLPDRFIKLAESHGLIGQLTDTIFAQSCAAAAAWPDHLLLSVNIAPVQLTDRMLPDHLAHVARQAGLAFNRLVFEITETGALADSTAARIICGDLRQRGARIALDDFGTGHANLQMVLDLPLDTLKIDAGFIRGSVDSTRSRALVGNVVALGRSLGLTIIAEGIEDEAQANFATLPGCDIGQGYLFGTPQPIDQAQAAPTPQAPIWTTGTGSAAPVARTPTQQGDRVAENVARLARFSAMAADTSMFHLAPISLWLQDFGTIKATISQWALQGMTDLRAFLTADPNRVLTLMRSVRLIKVNRKTLSLFEADNLEHLQENLDRVFCTDTTLETIDSIVSLWEGRNGFTYKAVDHSLSGRRIEVQLHATVLPGHEESWSRVLVAVEDVTNLESMRRDLERSESYARSLFEHSPVALWVKDFSGAKQLLDALRAEGVQDLRAFAQEQPDVMRSCVAAVRVLNVNHRAAMLLDAPADLRCDTGLLRMEHDIAEQLFELWSGTLLQDRESVCFRQDGTEVHVQLQLSVLPGYEQDWARVQVARIDLTARKAAENRLVHLQTYDSLTGMHTRSFYSDAIDRFDVAVEKQVTIIVIDVNGLKTVNDRFGHAEGDEMLRQVGVFLSTVCQPPTFACRIGGDEFAILLPDADETQGRRFIELVEESLYRHNLEGGNYQLSLSIGLATRQSAEPLTSTVKRADTEMYMAKRRYYAQMKQQPPALTLPPVPRH